MKRALWLLCAVATGLCAYAGAQVPMRAMTVAWTPSANVSFSVRDFLDTTVSQKLQNGLPQTVITRIYAYPERGKDPIALSVLSCRVVYDLWENTYRIERQTETQDKTWTVKSLDGVGRLCLEVDRLPLGDAKAYARVAGQRVYFAAMVELNPLSQDTVARIRRWLARPSGSQLDGNAFFGSFVSIFVSRKLGSAEKTLNVRSDFFTAPP
ncbi:MAG TPA: hypothetical protein VJR89_03145 [Polyangiales bacterium]|nr:hypothetical protein [Polyangiales bacterium]